MLEKKASHGTECVLVVDDEPELCWAMELILKQNGFGCRMASSGKEAIAFTRRERFRMAFLDAKLPDVEGLVLAQILRRSDPALKVVMVSGFFYGNDPKIEEALRKGLIIGFIGKPFKNDEIVQTIRKATEPAK